MPQRTVLTKRLPSGPDSPGGRLQRTAAVAGRPDAGNAVLVSCGRVRAHGV